VVSATEILRRRKDHSSVFGGGIKKPQYTASEHWQTSQCPPLNLIKKSPLAF